MSVRFRLALTVFLAGLAAALGCVVAVTLAFQRFEHESSYQRADAFLSSVVNMHSDLLDQHERYPEELRAFLASLVLYDPSNRLYLLDAQGAVLASSGPASQQRLARVALAPVQEAARAAATGDTQGAAYVMGDDPDNPGADTVVAARPVSRARIGPANSLGGYLYLVCSGKPVPGNRLALFGMSLARPALASVLAVLALTTALAAWTIVMVTRPLRVLSQDVAHAARDGFEAATPWPATAPGKRGQADEFERLRSGFHTLMSKLRMQWDELRRLDGFRRESVSNLSHDLRSPLTATVACLETLEQRWARDSSRAEDLRLVQVALRNTRNAAGMVRSLGDLALLDEPAFQLHLTRLDLAEVLSDITLRFTQRANQQGVSLHFEQKSGPVPVARVDIELFERAVANLLDNALKFTPSGKAVVVRVGDDVARPGRVQVCVQDSGRGIAEHDLPKRFDRLYQSRSNGPGPQTAQSVAPATSDEGKGLGLAIVKRIAELHQGTLSVSSVLGQGTTVTWDLPAAAA
jgi:signal transduction histidine kinase